MVGADLEVEQRRTQVVAVEVDKVAVLPSKSVAHVEVATVRMGLQFGGHTEAPKTMVELGIGVLARKVVDLGKVLNRPLVVAAAERADKMDL